MAPTTDPTTEPDAAPGIAKAIARLEDEGYAILPGVLAADECGELRDDLARLERDLGITPSQNSFEGRQTWRVYNLLAHGRRYQRIPVDPGVLAVVESVLDPGCLVSSLSSIAIGPGEVAQPIHADDQLLPIAKPHPAMVCNTMWALTEFTEENGATRLVPGSHRADHSPTYGQHYESIPAEMAAGSVLVWHGSLWHGGGANRTDRRRVGIAMNYCAGYVRQQENQQLGLPLELLRSFPRRLQELCGFGIYRGLIGHIDKRTPIEVVLGDPTGSAPIVWDARR